MPYDVVTLDTNIFANNHYDLERGLLAQLAQFKQGSARFILSEIVHSELKRHLVSATATKRQRLICLAREAKDSGLLPAAEAQQLVEICNGAAAPEAAVISRLESFADATGMEIISAATTSMQDLLSRYFSTSPPFEASGAKKKEFPDAIALMSIEAWASQSRLKVLAISNDVGWAAYATNSPHMDVQSDLATALSSFQEKNAQARQLVEDLLNSINLDHPPPLKEEIVAILKGIVEDIDANAVADSSEDFTAGSLKLKLTDVKLTSHCGSTTFNIVRIGANRIVFTVIATVYVSAAATFVFHGWEDDQGSYDYDQTDIEHDDWFETDLLFDIDTSDSTPQINDIELLEPPEEIDFGSIESTSAYFARRD
jgi:hypothetical protein